MKYSASLTFFTNMRTLDLTCHCMQQLWQQEVGHICRQHNHPGNTEKPSYKNMCEFSNMHFLLSQFYCTYRQYVPVLVINQHHPFVVKKWDKPHMKCQLTKMQLIIITRCALFLTLTSSVRPKSKYISIRPWLPTKCMLVF